jgi:hypothetical protein
METSIEYFQPIISKLMRLTRAQITQSIAQIGNDEVNVIPVNNSIKVSRAPQ